MDSIREISQKYYQEKIKRVKSGAQIIDLSMINPDLEPPRDLLDKLVEFTLKSNYSRYAVSRGIKPLREAFVNKYKSFNVKIKAEENICVSQGSKNGLLSILLSLGKEGQKVLIPKPYYPTFIYAANAAKLNLDYYDLADTEEEIISNIKKKIEESDIKFLILNFPNNPTGISVTKNFYDNLLSQINKKDLIVINDFAYAELDYINKLSSSLLEQDNIENLIEIFTLSKSYSVPGWRVAGVVGDSNLIKKIARYKTLVDYGIFLPIQMAGAFALNSESDLCQTYRDTYSRRASYVVEKLKEFGFEAKVPSAGCCVWAKLPKELDMTSYEFCIKLLKEHSIALQPGELYGDTSGSFRIALITNQGNLFKVISSIESIL